MLAGVYRLMLTKDYIVFFQLMYFSVANASRQHYQLHVPVH